MQDLAQRPAVSEEEFAALVDSLAGAPDGRARLAELLREDHSVYDQRGTATIVRMRGWVLLALSRIGLTDPALVFVLEELDTGTDPYLVAAAARALRSYPTPNAAFAPFVMRAFNNIRYHDDAVSFEGYGEYAVDSAATSAVGELIGTLAWLGPSASCVLTEIETLRAQPRGLSKKLLTDLNRAVKTIRGATPSDSCCALPASLGISFLSPPKLRRRAVETIGFEDQDGVRATFDELFRGQPSIVVFFYTRCDNPLKCSLTVTKLGRIRKILEARGLADKIRTAAITYDPAFDVAGRLRRYGEERGMQFDRRNRMLRSTGDFHVLRSHFKLGVNFIESLVNRHRIELFILDAEGRIAAGFQRIHWDEEQVVDRAVEVMRNARAPKAQAASTVFTSLAAAFFPKCPVCWSAYLSMFGIAGIPHLPVLQPVLIALMLINVVSVWFRARATGRMFAAYLVCAGAIAIAISTASPGWDSLAMWGVVLTLSGSVLSVVQHVKPTPQASTD